MGLFDKIKYAAFNQVESLIPNVPADAEIAFFAEIEMKSKAGVGWFEQFERNGVAYVQGANLILMPTGRDAIQVPLAGIEMSVTHSEIELKTGEVKYEVEKPVPLGEFAPPEAQLSAPFAAADTIQGELIDHLVSLLESRGAVMVSNSRSARR